MGRSSLTNEMSQIVRILEAFYCIMQKNYELAIMKLIHLDIQEADGDQKTAIHEVCTPLDICYYIALCTLMSCDRLTIKNTVLKSNFVGLIDVCNGQEALTLIDSFLNGNYYEFGRSLHAI